MPPGVMADWDVLAFYFCLNGYFCAGLDAAGKALADIGAPEAGAFVKDAESFHVPGLLWDYLPAFLKGAPEIQHRGSVPLPQIDLGFYQFPLTKFMVLEAVAALLMIFIFVPLAWFIASGRRPRGRFWNFFELLLVFLRDEVARPAIGRHDADRFLPFIWTAFFFILFCNLLGMVPWAGSPTGALAVTGTLALITFVTVTGAGMAKYGPAGFWTGMVPHMELPWVLAIILKPMLFE